MSEEKGSDRQDRKPSLDLTPKDPVRPDQVRRELADTQKKDNSPPPTPKPENPIEGRHDVSD